MNNSFSIKRSLVRCTKQRNSINYLETTECYDGDCIQMNEIVAVRINIAQSSQHGSKAQKKMPRLFEALYVESYFFRFKTFSTA